MLRQKLRRRLTGMIPRPVIDEKQRGRALRQDVAQERFVTVRGKPSLYALKNKRPEKYSRAPKTL